MATIPELVEMALEELAKADIEGKIPKERKPMPSEFMSPIIVQVRFSL